MSIIDRLQALVKERGMTFKQLEREVGLGNGTIRRWEEQSPRVDKLTKVADFLQVSLDYLVYGRDVLELSEGRKEEFEPKAVQEAQKLLCDGSPLDEEEADLVAMYRLLPDYRKEDVFDIVHTMYQKHVERKKESIYWTYKADRLKQKSTAADSDSSGSGQGVIA
jgi:transcriptional regulator with XRE-family HTH domain